MRILVTGAAGFLGSHVAERLAMSGHEVTALDDLSGGFIENIPLGVHFVRGSINDVGLVNEVFVLGKFDYVYHLAAYAAEGLSHFIKRFNYENNLIGSTTLINAAINHGIKCFVFASSIAVYGASPELPMTEDSPMRPDDPYGIAKMAVEHELRVCHDMFDLNYIVFRPHNVFGPRQNISDPYRNVVGIFMGQLMQGKPMTIFGDGTQTRAFSYVDDVVGIMSEAIDVPLAYNETFNIGDDTPYTVNELASAVARAMGKHPDVVHLPARHEVHDAYASHDKLHRVFGVRPTCNLDDGLRRMADWAKHHGVRQGQRFSNIEVTKNLPGVWAAYV